MNQSQTPIRYIVTKAQKKKKKKKKVNKSQKSQKPKLLTKLSNGWFCDLTRFLSEGQIRIITFFLIIIIIIIIIIIFFF